MTKYRVVECSITDLEETLNHEDCDDERIQTIIFNPNNAQCRIVYAEDSYQPVVNYMAQL